MSRFKTWLWMVAAVVATLALSDAVLAQREYSVTCKSSEYKYTTCRLETPGYVTLEQQESKAACVQGRTWDFDRREIWVDDGCGAKFRVHPQGSEHISGGQAAVAGAVLGAAILGALVEDKNHNYDDRHDDSNYYGPRHSSYIPPWMVGTFEGHNPQYGEDMTMTIRPDGRLSAVLDDGRRISGYVNNQEIHVENALLSVNRTRDGFATNPLGRHHNVLQYYRVDGFSTSPSYSGRDRSGGQSGPCDREPVLYADDSFRGGRLDLTESISDLHSRGFGDNASSLCVPRGWQITVFQDKGFSGPSLRIWGPSTIGDLRRDHPEGADWGDRISSVRVDRGW